MAAPVRRARRHDPALPPVFTLDDLAPLGLGRHHVATRVGAGEWITLRRGVHCTADAWGTADARGRLVLRTAAEVLGRPWAVVSHLSAAALHDWWLPLEPGGGHRPAVTAAPSAGVAARRVGGLTVRVAALDGDDLVGWDARPGHRRTPVTGPARSAADVARSLPLHEAVPLLDAAGRCGVGRDAVAAALVRQHRWPGVARARRALQLADPRRESWLETLGAVVAHGAGLTGLEPQVEVSDTSGRFVARVDHLWRERGVVVEADGWGKYTGREDLRAEKRREDALRDLGLEVVRYEARDVISRGRPTGDVLVARLAAAAARADPRRLDCRFRSTPRAIGW